MSESKLIIVFATNNIGKLHEIQQMTLNSSCQIIPQTNFSVPEVKETGLTFVENAIIKARNAYFYTKLPTIADDSGLEIDALNGEPGIYSARYAKKNATNEENIEKVLLKLKTTPIAKRTARFQCVMVYLKHSKDPSPLIAQGTWEGRILFAKQGSDGFGYDPIFFVPTHNCSAAELPSTIKNSLSHRGQALKKLMNQLSFINN